jgi:hypothetical protein
MTNTLSPHIAARLEYGIGDREADARDKKSARIAVDLHSSFRPSMPRRWILRAPRLGPVFS